MPEQTLRQRAKLARLAQQRQVEARRRQQERQYDYHVTSLLQADPRKRTEARRDVEYARVMWLILIGGLTLLAGILIAINADYVPGSQVEIYSEGKKTTVEVRK